MKFPWTQTKPVEPVKPRNIRSLAERAMDQVLDGKLKFESLAEYLIRDRGHSLRLDYPAAYVAATMLRVVELEKRIQELEARDRPEP